MERGGGRIEIIFVCLFAGVVFCYILIAILIYLQDYKKKIIFHLFLLAVCVVKSPNFSKIETEIDNDLSQNLIISSINSTVCC